YPEAGEECDRHHPGQQLGQEGRLGLPAVLDTMLVKLLRNIRVHADRDEPLLAVDRFLELARELALPDYDVRDLVLPHQLLEFTVGDGRDRLPPNPDILEDQHARQGDERVSEVEAGLLLIHLQHIPNAAQRRIPYAAARIASPRSIQANTNRISRPSES